MVFPLRQGLCTGVCTGAAAGPARRWPGPYRVSGCGVLSGLLFAGVEKVKSSAGESRVVSKREIAELLRRLFMVYRRSFDERAPEHDAPVPLLDQKAVDVVSVNGGGALHFFFSDPTGPLVPAGVSSRRVTRLHDVTLWPPTVVQQKEVERSGPGRHREMVRRVARIEGELYVHFVLYPEDGDLFESIGAVGDRLAQREVARHQGERLASEVPEQSVRVEADPAADEETGQDPVRVTSKDSPWDPELDPAP
jgi:hypothetical protein